MNFVGGGLKLKGAQIEKKKKKKKEKTIPSETAKKIESIEMTEAERVFLERKKQKRIEELEKQNLKSHKQKVEEFNAKLDKIPEHYDIPKVGPG